MKRINRFWRSLIATLCFIAFGIGGTLMSTIVMPLLMLTPGTAEARRYRARSFIGFSFRLLVHTLVASGCMTLRTQGFERLTQTRGTLVLANHPTYIDVVVLISLMPQANCVVKGALWRNPFYWGIVRAAYYINNASPEGVIEACTDALHQGETLLLFPEGTRTILGQSLRFQRGAAHIALKTGAAITPVLISCNPPTLTKDSPWWLAPERPFIFDVRICEALPTASTEASAEMPAIGARRLTKNLEDYFSHELKRYGFT